MTNIVEIVVRAKDSTGGLKGIGDKVKEDVIKGAKDAGKGWADQFFTGFRGFNLSPAMAGVIGIGALAAAPAIGATIAAAVIGGAGGLGMVGGIMAVADHPLVSQAAKRTGDNITNNLRIDADSMVEPVINGLGIIDDAFDKSSGNFKRIFDEASSYIEPWADTISGVMENVSSGFANMLEGAGGPVMQELMTGITETGEVIEEFFDDLGERGPEAAMAMQSAMTSLNGILSTTADGIIFLTDAFATIQPQMERFAEFYSFGFAETSGDAERSIGIWVEAAGAIDTAAEAASAAKSAIQALNDEMHAQFDPAFALIKAQNDLAKAQENYNKAVEKTGADSPKAREELYKIGQAALTIQANAGAAAGTFNGEMTPALRATLAAAKVTEPQINAIANSLRNAASAGNAYDGTYTARIVTEYIGRPFTGFSGINGSTFRGLAHGGISGAASGGPRNAETWVGEGGPELVSLPYGSTVHTAGDSQRMTRGNDGASAPATIIIDSAGSRLDDLLVEVLRRAIEAKGGVVQNVLGIPGKA